MIKIILLALALALNSCLFNSAPGAVESSKIVEIYSDEILEDTIVLKKDTIVLSQKDTIVLKKDLSEKKNFNQMQKAYDIQQKNVIKQIERLEEQQETLDSLLKKNN